MHHPLAMNRKDLAAATGDLFGEPLVAGQDDQLPCILGEVIQCGDHREVQRAQIRCVKSRGRITDRAGVTKQFSVSFDHQRNCPSADRQQIRGGQSDRQGRQGAVDGRADRLFATVNSCQSVQPGRPGGFGRVAEVGGVPVDPSKPPTGQSDEPLTGLVRQRAVRMNGRLGGAQFFNQLCTAMGQPDRSRRDARRGGRPSLQKIQLRQNRSDFRLHRSVIGCGPQGAWATRTDRPASWKPCA